MQGSHSAGRGVRSEQLLGLEGEDGQVMLGIQADQLVGAELKLEDGGLGGQLEDNAHAAFAEDVDLAAAKLGVFCSDGEQRLYGVVGELGDL